jgi:hypothetical protein
MRARSLANRAVRVALAPLMLAGVLISIGPDVASASTCVSWTGGQPPNVSSADNELNDVAVLSSCNAWAVGGYFTGAVFQTLIEHWNGTAWKLVPSPDPGGSARSNILYGVAATSPGNVWAVGYYSSGTAFQTLIVRWNGTSWSQVPSPDPGGTASPHILNGVVATSAGNAWAVGQYWNGTAYQTLTEHWNGTSWKHVASPNPAGSAKPNILSGVAATSPGNVWAVGQYNHGLVFQTLIEHWNGTSWKRVPSPNPGGSVRNNALYSVAATSTANAWAVGHYDHGTSFRTLIEHWNGTLWKAVANPNPVGSFGNALSGVTATSARNVWAVGFYFNGTASQTLIERWNGTSWQRVVSPDPGGSAKSNVLVGVDATSAGNAWAVGDYVIGSTGQTLALHCC